MREDSCQHAGITTGSPRELDALSDIVRYNEIDNLEQNLIIFADADLNVITRDVIPLYEQINGKGNITKIRCKGENSEHMFWGYFGMREYHGFTHLYVVSRNGRVEPAVQKLLSIDDKTVKISNQKTGRNRYDVRHIDGNLCAIYHKAL